MVVLEIAARGVKEATVFGVASKYAVLDAPVPRLLGMRLPSGQILAIEERHKPVNWGDRRRGDQVQFLNLDLAEFQRGRPELAQGNVARRQRA